MPQEVRFLFELLRQLILNHYTQSTIQSLNYRRFPLQFQKSPFYWHLHCLLAIVMSLHAKIRILSPSTRYTILCSSSMRLLQSPVRFPFKGSGFPIPSNGWRSMSLISWLIRFKFFLFSTCQWSLHAHAVHSSYGRGIKSGASLQKYTLKAMTDVCKVFDTVLLTSLERRRMSYR